MAGGEQPEVLYEAHFEQDSGFIITEKGTEPWTGWRVRYRPLGTRRWSRFVTADNLDNLSVDEIQALCRAAASGASA